MQPDVRQRLVADVVELESRDALGGVAGQHLAGRRHVHRAAAPAAHARLRPAGVIVGHDEVEHHHALVALLGGFNDVDGAHDLFAGRHQARAVLECPGIILDVRHLEPAGTGGDRPFDDRWQVVDVGPVDRRVDGQRHAELAHPSGQFALLGHPAFEGGDALSVDVVDVLDRQLHVVEPGVVERLQLVARQQHARGDQVRVQPDFGGRPDEVDEIAARRRLATREVKLQDAERGRLSEYPLPFGRRQLDVGLVHLERI